MQTIIIYILAFATIIFFVAWQSYQAGKNKVIVKNLKGLNDVSRKAKKTEDDISSLSDDALNKLL